MNRRLELAADIRSNPKDVRFDDACRIAEWLGFVAKGVHGSHYTSVRRDEPILLFCQSRSGRIPAYRARQPVAMIDKSGGRVMSEIGRYAATIFWDDEDEGFIALAPDLPGYSAFGETQTEALHELQDAISAWMKAASAHGREIPRPTKRAPGLAAVA